MSPSDPQRVLVLGGAGFLGSHISARLAATGASVTVIDGLLPRTGGRAEHLERLGSAVHFIAKRVEEAGELEEELERSDAVVDCMAWTSHHSALADPTYDLELNLQSHLHLLCRLPRGYRGQLVYLGSRSQYGAPEVPVIDEGTPMVPVDVQGTHKLAAESLFRVYAAARDLSVHSLRLPNCFGEYQQHEGEDIGLVGSFIRDLLLGREVTVYGSARRRTIAYAPDVAELVCALLDRPARGFEAYNVGGHDVEIHELARLLAGIVGAGRVRTRPMPAELARYDGADAVFSGEKLAPLVPGYEPTELSLALRRTVDYFARRLGIAREPRQ